MSKNYYIPSPEELIQKSGYTMVPHVFEDVIMPIISGSSWKILSLFIRQTYGFHRDLYSIGVNRIAEKTGMTTATVISNMKDLVDSGFLIITRYEDRHRGITREYKLIQGQLNID